MGSEWEPHKQRIHDLYIGQRQTLEEVRYTLNTENGFCAR